MFESCVSHPSLDELGKTARGYSHCRPRGCPGGRRPALFIPAERGTASTPSGNPPGNNPQCKGTAACFTDTVTYIVDGDTLDVGSTRIRLGLVTFYCSVSEFADEPWTGCPYGGTMPRY